MNNNGQLSYQDRVILQSYLENEIPIKVICKKLNVAKQTIYREIKRNGILKTHKMYVLRINCEHQGNCPYLPKGYNRCTKKCDHFIERQCKGITRFPFICNKCEKKSSCILIHRYYYADDAQKKTDNLRSSSRSGIRINEEEFKAIDELISPLLQEKGQSLNHILTSHPEIKVNERTIRNWINDGYTTAGNIDLPRKVAFKPKKEYIHRIVKPSNVLNGRTFHDYRIYCKENPNMIISQFDTVIGKIGDTQRLLTIHFPTLHFQFGILINNSTSEEVNKVISDLRIKIGTELWKKIFPIMLCDNGTEFNEFYNLEKNENDEKVSNVFYCDPYRSSQKGACERNHEFIRYIEPKYHSLNHLTQEKVNLMFSHINSYYRPGLNGVTPYDLAEMVLGKEFLDIIEIKKIEPKDVNLTQSLTKKIKK